MLAPFVFSLLIKEGPCTLACLVERVAHPRHWPCRLPSNGWPGSLMFLVSFPCAVLTRLDSTKKASTYSMSSTHQPTHRQSMQLSIIPPPTRTPLRTPPQRETNPGQHPTGRTTTGGGLRHSSGPQGSLAPDGDVAQGPRCRRAPRHDTVWDWTIRMMFQL